LTLVLETQDNTGEAVGSNSLSVDITLYKSRAAVPDSLLPTCVGVGKYV